jgi:taurine--2-oxoglutarate transaminase
MGAVGRLAAFLRENGFYTFVRWNMIHVNPPLCINEAELKEGLAILDKGLEITDNA